MALAGIVNEKGRIYTLAIEQRDERALFVPFCHIVVRIFRVIVFVSQVVGVQVEVCVFTKPFELGAFFANAAQIALTNRISTGKERVFFASTRFDLNG